MRTRLGHAPAATAFWRFFAGVLLGCLVLLGLNRDAQPLAAQQTFGVPIQLPTQSFFGVKTTVSVPDGGAISLGGNSGSAWSSTRRGGFGPLFTNRALGGTQFANNASVHVQILSQSEMEAELLGQLPPGRTLADYARPAPPRLFLHAAHAPSAPDSAFGNSEPSNSERTSDTSSRASRASIASPNAATNRAAKSSAATLPGPAELVDPNGSRAVQEKADFMSRHIGRKKK